MILSRAFKDSEVYKKSYQRNLKLFTGRKGTELKDFSKPYEMYVLP